MRLAWKLTAAGHSIIYVDACTGEILGGDQTQAYARSVAPVPDTYRNEICAAYAKLGLDRLGYTHHLNIVNYAIQAEDINYVINQSDLKALYLRCHGSQNGWISDNQNGLMSYQAVGGGFHFVFLDACWSSSNTLFPDAFIDTGGSGQCFVGWNVEVLQTTSYQFNRTFWPRVDYKYILDAVVFSLQQVRADGYADCDPGFWGDLDYWGRA